MDSPPLAERRPVTSVRHGVEIVDDYAWLRDERWREVLRDPAALDPAIREHLSAENAWTAAAMAGTEALRDDLYREMRGRIKEDDSSVPAPDGPWEYGVSFVTGGQHPRLVRRPRGAGPEAATVLVDGDAEAVGSPFWALGGSAHSDDHRLLAFSVDDRGSELYTVRVRDLASGEDLPDRVPGTRGGIVWTADGGSFLYVSLNDDMRPDRVLRHELGTSAADDAVVYAEADPGFYVGLGRTSSGRWIVIGSGDHETSEVRLVDAHRPDAAPVLVRARETGHEYEVDDAGDALVVLSNRDAAGAEAEDFCVLLASVADPGGQWTELVPHRPGRYIESIEAFAGHLVRLEREDGLPRIVVRRLSDGDEHAIAFAEAAYSLDLVPGYEHRTTTLRLRYSSMTTPAEVWDYDMDTRERTLRKRQEVPSGHDPADYVTERMHAPAADGALVPVSMLRRRDTPLDGSAPLLLYGYGAYGLPMPAGFSTTRLSLVDRGFVYAIAHVRGGKDKGTRWYLDGKRQHKVNTFTDFIAVGEHLAATGVTSRGRIVAAGGSAGGMLVGAVANMAPDLFLGILADVPFVDVLNTMLDASLPLTPPEWPEWGNPIESREDFERIRGYSPYDNVAAQEYPHILALAGLTDPRVTYWEPAKWVARLRERSTGDRLLLLKVDMESGHGGASGRFDALHDVALEQAFALRIAGLAEGARIGA